MSQKRGRKDKNRRNLEEGEVWKKLVQIPTGTLVKPTDAKNYFPSESKKDNNLSSSLIGSNAW
jgi:hypothetical protein